MLTSDIHFTYVLRLFRCNRTYKMPLIVLNNLLYTLWYNFNMKSYVEHDYYSELKHYKVRGKLQNLYKKS